MRLVIQNTYVSGRVSSSAGGSTEGLKAPNGAKSKVWKHFGFVTNEAGMTLSKT